MIYQVHLCMYPKELKASSQRNVYTLTFMVAFIHNTRKVKATQMSITDEWIRQNVAYTYNGISFTLKKGKKF